MQPPASLQANQVVANFSSGTFAPNWRFLRRRSSCTERAAYLALNPSNASPTGCERQIRSTSVLKQSSTESELGVRKENPQARPTWPINASAGPPLSESSDSAKAEKNGSGARF